MTYSGLGNACTDVVSLGKRPVVVEARDEDRGDSRMERGRVSGGSCRFL